MNGRVRVELVTEDENRASFLASSVSDADTKMALLTNMGLFDKNRLRRVTYHAEHALERGHFNTHPFREHENGHIENR